MTQTSPSFTLQPANPTRRPKPIENPQQGPQPRETIWSIVASLRRWYFGIFLILYIIGAAFIIAGEIRADKDIIGTVTGIFLGLSAAGTIAAVTAFALVESGRTFMVLAHDIQKWLEERRTKRIAAALEQGRTEANEAWSAWNTRRLEAESRGEPFNEPPPNGTAD